MSIQRPSAKKKHEQPNMRILAAVSFPRKDDQKITNETREKAIATVGNKMSHEDSTEKS